MDRDGLSREEALNRINSQMTQEEKNEKADKIIKNESNMDNLEKQVERALEHTLKGIYMR